MLADTLREARQKKSLTQAQLATTLGCSPGYIAHLENGRAWPSEAKLLKLCDLLDLDKRRLILERQKEKASGDARAYYEPENEQGALFRLGSDLSPEHLAYALKVIRAIEKNRRVRDAIDLLIGGVK